MALNNYRVVVTPTIRELRIGWAVLAGCTALALLPDDPSSTLVTWWGTLACAGAASLTRPTWGARSAQAATGSLTSVAGRTNTLVLVGLLVVISLLFSPSAALLLAMTLGLATFWCAVRSVDMAMRFLCRTAIVGGALLLALTPIELLLRVPVIARQYGLPVEQFRERASYDSLWARNVFRFRAPYEQVARRAGVTRVLALGDSFTWGLRIGSSDSVWPAVLERHLTRDSGGAAEVINMGQRGWTTANEAELLRRLGWQFDPDLVLVQYYVNDAYPSAPDFRFDEPSRTHLLPDQFFKGYVRTSSLAALVSLAVNGVIYGVLHKNDESGAMYERDAEGYRQLREALHEMGDSATARKVPLVYILFPSLVAGTWTTDTYPLRDTYGRIAGDALDANLRVLDLTGTFASEGGDWSRWWATPYDSHPNAAAHALAARAIHDFLRAESLLPDSSRTKARS